MSELQPTAKAVIKTTKGSIEIELFAKETPQTSKAFLTSILNEKYNNLKFTVEPTQINLTNNTISYNLPDEFHTRIRFTRGTLGAIRSKKNHNSIDGFFIVLNDSPDLNSRYVAFGRAVGSESLYTVQKIMDGEVDSEGVPVFPVSVVSSEVNVAYFDDLKKEEKSVEELVEKPVKKRKVTMRYEESDEEDEEFKIKSAHDVLKDTSLSREVAKEQEETVPEQEEQEEEGSEAEHEEQEDPVPEHSERSHSEQEDNSHSDSPDSSESSDEETHIHIQVQRDPTIDSEYDSNLDLSECENPITLDMLKKHKFTTVK
ncbi:Peptidyl-prolyl isomerase CWC27 [Spathaspora sp. JA1]|nr:Peptidyl-prolyl isomerase CWC27 [Spathaspora sp. JA1]